MAFDDDNVDLLRRNWFMNWSGERNGRLYQLVSFNNVYYICITLSFLPPQLNKNCMYKKYRMKSLINNFFDSGKEYCNL